MRLKYEVFETIGAEMQERSPKTKARGQHKEKDFMLGLYENISTLLGSLFKPDAADTHYLESKVSGDQEGEGLKVLTPDQMFSRLTISLVQLKAGNNSEKLENEIRQLLHSLHRSKKLTKTIYNNLINTI